MMRSHRDSVKAGTSRTTVILILAGVIASALFAALSWLRLNSMQRALDGLVPPDLLLTGYNPAYVELVQTAMTDELYESYATVHYLWDVLFVLAFAATLVVLIVRIAGGKVMKWVLLPVPLIFAAADITENILIERMFATIPPTSELVALASTFTVVKFILFAACLLAVLAALLIRPKS